MESSVETLRIIENRCHLKWKRCLRQHRQLMAPTRAHSLNKSDTLTSLSKHKQQVLQRNVDESRTDEINFSNNRGHVFDG